MNVGENIHPVFDRMLGREAKEARLGQRGLVLWLYGLSGSGKSTIAIALERRLAAEGFFTQILDGDNIRSGLNRNLGFSDEDRTENIRRIAEVAKLFVRAGVVTLTSFITPRRDLRDLARGIIGPADFCEVYVSASFATCAERDPKGLYAKAAGGGVPQFTGQDSAFEEPESADLVIPTERLSVDEAVGLLHRQVIDRIREV
jgi:adenylylsulfate kinase